MFSFKVCLLLTWHTGVVCFGVLDWKAYWTMLIYIWKCTHMYTVHQSFCHTCRIKGTLFLIYCTEICVVSGMASALRISSCMDRALARCPQLTWHHGLSVLLWSSTLHSPLGWEWPSLTPRKRTALMPSLSKFLDRERILVLFSVLSMIQIFNIYSKSIFLVSYNNYTIVNFKVSVKRTEWRLCLKLKWWQIISGKRSMKNFSNHSCGIISICTVPKPKYSIEILIVQHRSSVTHLALVPIKVEYTFCKSLWTNVGCYLANNYSSWGPYLFT